MALHIYRVTVRGFFTDLSRDTRARLLADVEDHDALHAAFTEAGTLTYDRTLAAFSFRIQLRVQTDDDGGDDRDLADARAEELGLERAAARLAELGAPAKRLRVTTSNMADVWRRQPDARA